RVAGKRLLDDEEQRVEEDDHEDEQREDHPRPSRRAALARLRARHVDRQRRRRHQPAAAVVPAPTDAPASSVASPGRKCSTMRWPREGGERSGRLSAHISTPPTSTYSRCAEPRHCTSETVASIALQPGWPSSASACGRMHSVRASPGRAGMWLVTSSMRAPSRTQRCCSRSSQRSTVTGSRLALHTNVAVKREGGCW